MPHIARRKLMIAAALILLLLLVTLYLPVRIPYSVSAYGRVLSAREWVLVHDGGGQFVSFLRDNGSGMVDEYAVTEQQRGDPTRFHLRAIRNCLCSVSCPATPSAGCVPPNSIVNSVCSKFRRCRAGRVSSARSGEKDALVARRGPHSRKRRHCGMSMPTSIRRRLELHEKDIISDDEMEISRDRLRVLDAGVAMAEAQVAAMRSGLKEEDIRVRLAEVAAFESELAALRERARGISSSARRSACIVRTHTRVTPC
jgi:hypothetical protein